MTATQLLEAMRPGSRSHWMRDTDLGRFAGDENCLIFPVSPSTVVTSKPARSPPLAGISTTRQVNEWLVEIPEHPLEIPWADKLGSSGTLVVWEKLDRHLRTLPRRKRSSISFAV